MTKQSCVNHVPNSQLLIIREDYAAICADGTDNWRICCCAASILNILEYWTNIKISNSKQAKIENDIAESGGQERSQNEDLWIYKTMPDFQQELFGMFGLSYISEALKLLSAMGYVDTRNNPKFKWDRTLQYKLCSDNVNEALKAVNLEIATLKFKEWKSQIYGIEGGKFKATIPEITTKTTKKKDMPRGVDFSPANKKESSKEHPPSPRARKPDLLFNAICEHCFGCSHTNVGAAASRVAKIKSELLKAIPNLTVQEFVAGIEDFVGQFPNAAIPKAPDKLLTYIEEARRDATPAIKPTTDSVVQEIRPPNYNPFGE